MKKVDPTKKIQFTMEVATDIRVFRLEVSKQIIYRI